MEISEIRMAKIGLERTIAALLDGFEQKTRTTITSIEIEILEGKNIFQDSRHKTTIRIEL